MSDNGHDHELNRTLTRDVTDDEESTLPVQPGERELTTAEKKVLRVLCDPSMAKKSNLERIDAADVGKTTYYEIMRDPWFRQQQHSAFRDMIRNDLAGIIKAMVETAKTPGRDGQNDRRLALELCGMYTPRQAVEIDTPKQIIGVVGIAMDEI